MGLKIRLGLAGMGLFMSYFFGLHGLTGIASHLDSTGNILVDIADGIGLVSKGIEALETWVDPTSQPTVEQPEENSAGGIATNPSPPQSIENQKTTEIPTPTAVPKPVICKKGKCQPYDPTKDRVLQQQLIKAERERILQQIQSGALPADTAVPVAQLLDEDGEEIDDDELPKIRKLRAAQKQIKASSSSSQKSSTSSGGTTTTSTVSSTPAPSIQILDPSSPNLDLNQQQEQESNEISSGGWRFGAKRILGSFAGVCQRLNQLLLKVVAKVFPWNRRAKRRLRVGGADDEE